MSNKETYNKIEAYLFGRMSETEKANFETELLTNATLAKQFEEQKLEHETMESLVQKDLMKDLKQWRTEIDGSDILDSPNAQPPDTPINPNLFNWNTFLPIIGFLTLCLIAVLIFSPFSTERQEPPIINRLLPDAAVTDSSKNSPLAIAYDAKKTTLEETAPSAILPQETEKKPSTNLLLEEKTTEENLFYNIIHPNKKNLADTVREGYTTQETTPSKAETLGGSTIKGNTETKATSSIPPLAFPELIPPQKISEITILNSPAPIPNPCIPDSFLNIIEPEMVFVKRNGFIMGSTYKNARSPGEAPLHQVIISDFSIGKYEVTNEEFVVFLNAEGNQVEDSKTWIALNVKKVGIQKEGDCFSVKPGYEKFPVTFVSWFGAQAYTRWLSKMTNKTYRLPTEAEWEYAARGGSKIKSYKYAGSDKPDKVAWYKKNARSSFHEVGTKKANTLETYDMSGNVSEWCLDWYKTDYYAICSEKGKVRNPEGSEKGSEKILRGGSWVSPLDDLRCTNRHKYDPSFRRNRIGFRLAQAVE